MLPSLHRAPCGQRPRPPVLDGWVEHAAPTHHSLVACPSQLARQPPRRPGQAGYYQRRRRQWHRDPFLASSSHGAPRRCPARPPATPDSPATPTTASLTSLTNDSVRDSPIASFTQPPVPSNTVCLHRRRQHLAHARAPKISAWRGAHSAGARL